MSINRKSSTSQNAEIVNNSQKSIHKKNLFSTGNLILGLLVFTAIFSLGYLGQITNFFDHNNSKVIHFDNSMRKDDIAPLLRIPSEPKEIRQPITKELSVPTPPINVQPQDPEKTSEKVKNDNSFSSQAYQLPGADLHPILRLSVEELRSTSFDQLMSGYAEALGGGTCEKDFGNQLIKEWRNTKKLNCAPRNSDENQSKINCYLMHQSNHHGNGDNLCVFENVAIDLGKFDDDKFTSKIIKNYVDTRHMKQPYPDFPRGFIKGACDPVPGEWRSDLMPGWNVDLSVNAFEPISGKLEDICSEWIDHPVLLTERDTFANFFHDSEDFVNAFLAMAVLQWTPEESQIFLMDLYPRGPFWSMWSDVFSHGHDTMTSWDLKKKFSPKTDNKHNYVCFKKVAMGIYGPAAPTTICSWDTSCTRTALVRSYSDFVIRSMNLQQYTHYSQPQPSQEIVITYMSRRATKEWPEKKYCDSQNSFFLCQYWENFGPRQLGRMVRNDAEVVAALKSFAANYKAKKVVIKDVDFNILTLKEQIKVDLETDLMIGPHGAGLMHNIFMRDRAMLLELFVDGSSANRHFHNLAFWYGRRYQGVSIENPINTDRLISLVQQAVEHIDLTKY